MKMTKISKDVYKRAFIKTIPIMFSYIFISIAFGLLMENAGFAWYYSLLASMLIYTGAFQFALVTFLSAGTSVLTILFSALLMNSRHAFYSISFIDTFRSMKKRKLFMIRTMTDETYALNCSIDENDKDRNDLMFLMAILSRIYWLSGTVVGALIGQALPYDLTGIDFCMTALFVVIFIDQWEGMKDHSPAILGLIIATICLFIFGENAFMLPALIIVCAVLLLKNSKNKEEV